jgi:hypothetical protein
MQRETSIRPRKTSERFFLGLLLIRRLGTDNFSNSNTLREIRFSALWLTTPRRVNDSETRINRAARKSFTTNHIPKISRKPSRPESAAVRLSNGCCPPQRLSCTRHPKPNTLSNQSPHFFIRNRRKSHKTKARPKPNSNRNRLYSAPISSSAIPTQVTTSNIQVGESNHHNPIFSGIRDTPQFCLHRAGRI